jgi:UDP-2-acetamido-2,6-beta-L-arabino-hexul-4-ose reductase
MPFEPPVIAVTGANGFIGRNLVLRLRESGFTLRPIVRETPGDAMWAALAEADVVVHLAGVNRPADPADFLRVNRDHTAEVARAIAAGERRPLVIFASSAKAVEDSDYGRSKSAGEAVLLDLAKRADARVAIYRLPNVFGRWARPDYNSAVATFCHNIARGLPIRIDDPLAPLKLLYIDDLIDQWLALIADPPTRDGLITPDNVYRTTVGDVAATVRGFASGAAPEDGAAFACALHATFVAASPSEQVRSSLVGTEL